MKFNCTFHHLFVSIEKCCHSIKVGCREEAEDENESFKGCIEQLEWNCSWHKKKSWKVMGWGCASLKSEISWDHIIWCLMFLRQSDQVFIALKMQRSRLVLIDATLWLQIFSHHFCVCYSDTLNGFDFPST